MWMMQLDTFKNYGAYDMLYLSTDKWLNLKVHFHTHFS